jgi:hypothetical protein
MTNNDEKHGKLTTGAPANLGRRAAMGAGLAAAVAVVAGLATNKRVCGRRVLNRLFRRLVAKTCPRPISGKRAAYD